MCSYIVEKTALVGSAKGRKGWMRIDTANVYFDHPYHAPLDHALGIPGVVFEPAGLSADRWTVSGGRTLTDAELERLDPC